MIKLIQQPQIFVLILKMLIFFVQILYQFFLKRCIIINTKLAINSTASLSVLNAHVENAKRFNETRESLESYC